jgi:hypothetical protein
MWRGGPLMYVEFGSVDYDELLRKSLCYMECCILGLYDFKVLCRCIISRKAPIFWII